MEVGEGMSLFLIIFLIISDAAAVVVLHVLSDVSLKLALSAFICGLNAGMALVSIAFWIAA